jgi:hypothetical protein
LLHTEGSGFPRDEHAVPEKEERTNEQNRFIYFMHQRLIDVVQYKTHHFLF